MVNIQSYFSLVSLSRSESICLTNLPYQFTVKPVKSYKIDTTKLFSRDSFLFKGTICGGHDCVIQVESNLSSLATPKCTMTSFQGILIWLPYTELIDLQISRLVFSFFFLFCLNSSIFRSCNRFYIKTDAPLKSFVFCPTFLDHLCLRPCPYYKHS